jgi:phosphoenolpyruvate carboxylase
LVNRKKLCVAVKTHPVFSTFVRALEYTLAKVEPAIWRLYLEQSELTPEIKLEQWRAFENEYRRSLKFLRDILGASESIAWRPWLRSSIELRSPMIHPLNLLQMVAIETHDVDF